MSDIVPRPAAPPKIKVRPVAGSPVGSSKPPGSGKPPQPPPKAPPAAPDPGDDGPRRRKIVQRATNSLRPHPAQNKYFESMPKAAFDELVENIRLYGIKEPIEILPDGTIISGHTRWLAAIVLGLDEVPVIVRDDLATASSAHVELALIEANQLRRQLSMVEQAKLFVEVRRLKEEAGEKFKRGDLRDEFASRFNISGRSVDRLVEVVELPLELQKAVAEKKTARQTALKLGQLELSEIEPVLELLRAEADGKAVRYAAYDILGKYDFSIEMTDARLARRLRDWIRDGAGLRAHIKELKEVVYNGQGEQLKTIQTMGKELLAELAARAKAREAKEHDSDDDAAATDHGEEDGAPSEDADGVDDADVENGDGEYV